MRTLRDALDRAKSLRDFKQASPERFEKTADYEDIVNLADEVVRLTLELNPLQNAESILPLTLNLQ